MHAWIPRDAHELHLLLKPSQSLGANAVGERKEMHDLVPPQNPTALVGLTCNDVEITATEGRNAKFIPMATPRPYMEADIKRYA